MPEVVPPLKMHQHFVQTQAVLERNVSTKTSRRVRKRNSQMAAQDISVDQATTTRLPVSITAGAAAIPILQNVTAGSQDSRVYQISKHAQAAHEVFTAAARMTLNVVIS